MVYAEFHEQGDVEKLLGWKPIPLFDRDNYPELASMQVRTICTMFQYTRVLYLEFLNFNIDTMSNSTIYENS